MIISTNRMSTMNGNYVVAANENYSVNDIGTILYESAQNDMQIFNAILKSDYTEIRARQEGTMLESELASVNEASIKGLFSSLIAQLKKFWEKIKGVFKDAYAMIAAYCVRNGKLFVKTNKKAIDELTNNSKVKGKIFVPANAFDYATKGINDNDVNKFLIKDKSASEIAKNVLKEKFDGFDGGNLFKYLKSEYFEEKDGTATLQDFGGVGLMVAQLTNGSKFIKALNIEEKRIEAAIKAEIKDLQAHDKFSHTKDKDFEYDAKMYRNAVSALTVVSSTQARAKIRLTKFHLLQLRLALARAITAEKPEGDSKDAEVKLLTASADMMAIAEMEDACSEDHSDMAPELAEEVLEIVSDAIDQAAENVGDDDEGSED